MASLLLAKAEAVARMRKQLLYIATLNMLKTFDVLEHTIPLNKLFKNREHPTRNSCSLFENSTLVLLQESSDIFQGFRGCYIRLYPNDSFTRFMTAVSF